ncbi:MAG: TRAP transporter small permease subunit [Gammaproteobacteria bacterium]|nr:TRAP transporter small permease subunit [Gammaproteobacteria bacterium]MDH3429997.1 TRAP transporter small permease subunit [Gammaproteobacteria bacterium]MDH3433564.1 TRAP transporter small permease subunit [Gammaproteobacteria bacterium]
MSSGLIAFLSRLDRFGRLLENVALVAMLGGMIALAVGQIVLREVFDTGIIWVDELLKLMVLWLAMVGSIAACRDDRHIRIDVLSHLLPDWLVDITRIVVDIFAAVVCAVIAVQAWRYLQIEIEFEDTVLVDTPAWIAHVILPVAFALISYRFVILAIKKIASLFTGVGKVATP